MIAQERLLAQPVLRRVQHGSRRPHGRELRGRFGGGGLTFSNSNVTTLTLRAK
jgi:hypothetical protein